MNADTYAVSSNPTYNRFIYELKYALSGLTSGELLNILKDASIEAGKTTAKNKVEAVKGFAKSMNNTISRYRRDGIKDSLESDFLKAKDFAKQVPDKFRNVYNNFIGLSREEQIEQLAVLILTVSIFYLSAGGSDIEGGLPDMDIAIGGIGVHRNLFSHTILLGFGIEFGARLGIRLFGALQERLPENHLPVWDKTYSFLDTHKDKGIAAMWAGIGLHLLKDSGILIGGVKPYTGLPGSMTMEAHQALFAANGLACGMFAVKQP